MCVAGERPKVTMAGNRSEFDWRDGDSGHVRGFRYPGNTFMPEIMEVQVWDGGAGGIGPGPCRADGADRVVRA